eukprot:TRINITY_DN64450_c0_g1_i1.p1 TRINITY_DN64450_c0_g1~~TRINITY_DN64450_c0_g1_i1.p1  ORF type:complete len:248 (-),score=42.93 TRINITY_DN64450_c0_g1_i1:124-867(-)
MSLTRYGDGHFATEADTGRRVDSEGVDNTFRSKAVEFDKHDVERSILVKGLSDLPVGCWRESVGAAAATTATTTKVDVETKLVDAGSGPAIPTSASSSRWYDPLEGGRTEPVYTLAGAYKAEKVRRQSLEIELMKLRIENEQIGNKLGILDARIRNFRDHIDDLWRQKPAECGLCWKQSLQADCAAQSLTGAVGHIVSAVTGDTTADSTELLRIVLRYLAPVRHLDADLEELFNRATEVAPLPRLLR